MVRSVEIVEGSIKLVTITLDLSLSLFESAVEFKKASGDAEPIFDDELLERIKSGGDKEEEEGDVPEYDPTELELQ